MKSRFNIETVVGIFLILGFICFAYLAVKLGDINLFKQDFYRVSAHFTSVSGLKKGANVELAGVKIGKVSNIALDNENYEAAVTMQIRKEVKLPEDVIASIKTSGIIGDKYVSIQPGGSDVYLKDGDEIMETESALDIEELISKYIFEKE